MIDAMTLRSLKESEDKVETALLLALGEASALFMSQDCKGTEIVMPSTELAEIATRYAGYVKTVEGDE